MKIKRLTATFGKLKNETLEPGPGLTVVSAPNEYGKTTWCAFLNAMLYGVDTSERDKAGSLSVKTRYRPWDGGAMVGTMEIERAGRDITLQRTTKGSSPMKNFIAVYSGTADFIDELTGENVGETLTGVSKQVFERTAFIRRPDIRVNQTSELERKIAGIVSSGEEDASYTDSDAALRRWQRRLKFNNNGSIPAIEEEIRERKKALELIESSNDEIANLRSNMDRQKKQIELMERDLEIHDKLDKRAAARRYREAEKNAKDTAKRVDELTAALTRNGHRVTREDINEIREKASAVMPLKKVAQDAERALWRAEKELVDAATRRESSPLSGRTGESVSADIARGRELEAKAKDVKEPKIPRLIPIALCCLAVLGLILTTGLLATMYDPGSAPEIVRFNLAGVIASLAVGAVGLVLFFIKLPKKRGAAEELAELLDSYGVQSVDKLSSLLTSYTQTLREEERARAARDAAREAYESAGAAAQEAGEEAARRLSAFMPGVTSGDEMMEALNETERLIDSLTHAQFEAVAARNVFETTPADFEESADDDTYLPVPIRSREDTVAAIDRARRALSDATRAYDLAVGAQRTLGDPAVIEGRIQTLTERLEEQRRQYTALALAIEALSGANTELQTRFSPEVSRLAGEYMSRLTDGRYERLYFDKGFDAGAKEAASPEARRVIALSDGTADEIYLSLRLALCELILGSDDPCPIILDDALANFDDARCSRALALLRELSRRRQIILFSCHNREADLLDQYPDVTVIRA